MTSVIMLIPTSALHLYFQTKQCLLIVGTDFNFAHTITMIRGHSFVKLNVNFSMSGYPLPLLSVNLFQPKDAICCCHF